MENADIIRWRWLIRFSMCVCVCVWVGGLLWVGERLEDFFSTPDFTSAVRAFVDEHDSAFVYVEEGEEQPLGNYDVYLKYTKLIEEQLETFLSGHGIDQQVW